MQLWLRALMLWTSFNTLRKGHGERSDAAVVGAMRKSSLLTF